MSVDAKAENERVAVVPVEAGTHLLRYLSSSASLPPCLFARVSPISEAFVKLIFVPGSSQAALAAPGDHAVVVAEKSGSLHLTIVASPGSSADAQIQIEPMNGASHVATSSAPDASHQGCTVWRRPSALVPHPSASPVIAPGAPASAKFSGFSKGASIFSFMCHVARRGDVVAGSGEWIGGPVSPAVIEGVTINWAAPVGISLEYQVLVQGAEDRWSAWVKAGEFAGSRGRRLPIVALRVRIAGNSAGRFKLSGEAIFLGCAGVAETGTHLEFTSYANADPLVGLKLELTESVAALRAASDARLLESGDKTGGAGRLRVFKTGNSPGRFKLSGKANFPDRATVTEVAAPLDANASPLESGGKVGGAGRFKLFKSADSAERSKRSTETIIPDRVTVAENAAQREVASCANADTLVELELKPTESDGAPQSAPTASPLKSEIKTGGAERFRFFKSERV
jgi:hypothetical protein